MCLKQLCITGQPCVMTRGGGGALCGAGVKNQYIIKGMTHGMGLHLVLYIYFLYFS